MDPSPPSKKQRTEDRAEDTTIDTAEVMAIVTAASAVIHAAEDTAFETAKDSIVETTGDAAIDFDTVKDSIVDTAGDSAIDMPSSSLPLVVLAPSASGASTSSWMLRWKEKLKIGLNAVEVVTFDYPYIPKANQLVNIHKDFVKEAVAKYPGHPLILAGKSLGSRVSCLVASKDDVDAKGIICLGYPLKGNGTLRDEELLQSSVPIMFVQGSKDVFCPLDKLNSVRKKMKYKSELYVIDHGDHSFKISKKDLETLGSTQDDAEDLAVEAIASFVYSCLNQEFDLTANSC